MLIFIPPQPKMDPQNPMINIILILVSGAALIFALVGIINSVFDLNIF